MRASGASRTGSSPLARGTLCPAATLLRAARFIPARAGNTSPYSNRSCPSSVHPRSRGEHSLDLSEVRDLTGSSPLARGTRGPALAPGHAGRFIPARAGNTLPTQLDRPFLPVHPRSRGEHWDCDSEWQDQSGSSPLARGTHTSNSSDKRSRRFIPARAGNTRELKSWSSFWPVHPRSRGEHPTELTEQQFDDGSSPLARGTHRRHRLRRGPRRFIPARAGNTSPPAPRRSSSTVHPRSRGEHC